MTAHTLMRKLQSFQGKRVIDCIDEITKIANAARYSVNVTDPDYNVSSINEDLSRLNVRTNENSVITSFAIG